MAGQTTASARAALPEAESENASGAAETRNLRVLLADDHVLFRKGFRLLLQQIFPGTSVVEAGDAEEALAVLGSDGAISLVFLDLAMPGMTGADAVRRFVGHSAAVPVVILSGAFDPAEILAHIDAGARGFLPKGSTESVLGHVVPLVLSGEIYVPAYAFAHGGTLARPGPGDPLAGLAADNPLQQLTARQLDTLAHMVEGLSNKEIARELGVLESTVKAHVRVILGKLDVQNRTQAVLKAQALGWTPARARSTQPPRD